MGTLIKTALKKVLTSIRHFAHFALKVDLRKYQLAPAQAIVNSVFAHEGLTFAVMMSRQAGKNELSAVLEAYFLNIFQLVGGQIVKAAPTFKPQVHISKSRLEDKLNNEWNRDHVRSLSGYILQLGKAACVFLSAQPTANVVGQTASILLECDEAQDIDEEKWFKDFAPMAAATNTTTVFYGTAWTSQTLLAKAIRDLRRLEAQDGIQRVFVIPWELVAAENPAYGQYVLTQIQRLGRDHPLIKSQYFLEEIDAEGGMFPEHRQVQMQGDHLPYLDPTLSERPQAALHAILIDVGGESDQGHGTSLTTRDYTALTIVEVDLSTVADPLIGSPTYRVVHRQEWLGIPHTRLYATLIDLIENIWHPRHVVIDATGVGSGLASFLSTRLHDTLIPFIFSSTSKSQLGWDFLAICDTGRFKDHALDPTNRPQRRFWQQVQAADYEILPGPGQRMKWGVADPQIHDDLLISAAFTAVLDKQNWSLYQDSQVIEAPDPLHEIDRTRGF